ncbi:MAG: cytochrome P450 [Acidobacteriota bacterium]
MTDPRVAPALPHPAATSPLDRLRHRQTRDGDVFQIDDDTHCILDPDLAQRFNSENYRDQTLSDRLVDVIRRRRSPPITWNELRASWLDQLRRLGNADGARALSSRMDDALAARVDRRLDLARTTTDLGCRSLIPTVIDGLSGSSRAVIERDQEIKIDRILGVSGPGRIAKLRWFRAQIVAGWAVRRELRGRQNGRRSRRSDLTDPIVELMPRLGMDRAADSVMAVLTAIAGPPGVAMSCLLYEWARQHAWRTQMIDELRSISIDDLARTPSRTAPISHRFVRECLRFWSLPLLMVRPVEHDFEIDTHVFKEGESVLSSIYLIHHDPRHCPSPEVFDPDRWRVAEQCPRGNANIPFGWAPRSCIGASLGILQMLLFCRLLATTYRVEVDDLEAITVEFRSVPNVTGFHGFLRRR